MVVGVPSEPQSSGMPASAEGCRERGGRDGRCGRAPPQRAEHRTAQPRVRAWCHAPSLTGEGPHHLVGRGRGGGVGGVRLDQGSIVQVALGADDLAAVGVGVKLGSLVAADVCRRAQQAAGRMEERGRKLSAACVTLSTALPTRVEQRARLAQPLTLHSVATCLVPPLPRPENLALD